MAFSAHSLLGATSVIDAQIMNVREFVHLPESFTRKRSSASCCRMVKSVWWLAAVVTRRKGKLCMGRAMALALLLPCLLLREGFGLESGPTRRILILNETGTRFPVVPLVDQGIRDALKDAPFQV